MKKIFTLLALCFLFLSASAAKNPFIRIYDAAGKKIEAGRLTAVTDSSVMVTSGYTTSEISFHQIAVIKTGHNAAHDILIAALITAPIVFLYTTIRIHAENASKAPSSSNGMFNINLNLPSNESFAAGVGVLTSVTAGSAAYLIKKKRTFINDGTAISEKKLGEALSAYLKAYHK